MEPQRQRVGVIGANGFIGSAILQVLIQSGVTLTALCGPHLESRPIPDGIASRTCDLADIQSLKPWVSGLDVVIHAAGPPSVRRSFEVPEEYLRVHVQGTAAVVKACHEANVARLVYISSAEVYGRPESNPVGEDHRLEPRSPYAAAKIGAEKIIESYAENFGLKAIILRPFSIYGPNPPRESLLADIVSMAHGGSIRLRDFRPIRDYCYVEDLALAVLKASRVALEKLKVFNIGTGEGTSVADFAVLILRSMGIDLPLLEDRSRARPPESEIFELVADISAARNVLGWRPETSLRQGIPKALALRQSEV